MRKVTCNVMIFVGWALICKLAYGLTISDPVYWVSLAALMLVQINSSIGD